MTAPYLVASGSIVTPAGTYGGSDYIDVPLPVGARVGDVLLFACPYYAASVLSCYGGTQLVSSQAWAAYFVLTADHVSAGTVRTAQYNNGVTVSSEGTTAHWWLLSAVAAVVGVTAAAVGTADPAAVSGSAGVDNLYVVLSDAYCYALYGNYTDNTPPAGYSVLGAPKTGNNFYGYDRVVLSAKVSTAGSDDPGASSKTDTTTTGWGFCVGVAFAGTAPDPALTARQQGLMLCGVG